MRNQSKSSKSSPGSIPDPVGNAFGEALPVFEAHARVAFDSIISGLREDVVTTLEFQKSALIKELDEKGRH